MDVIREHIKNGSKVYIYCPTGLARKYYHQWAQREEFSSKPSKRKDFNKVYLYKCPQCQRKNYIEGYTDFECCEREYPQLLDEQSWYTHYDGYYGKIDSYAVQCHYCAVKYDDYFLIHSTFDTPLEVNLTEGDKIMRETCNAVLICDYDSMDEELKRELRRHDAALFRKFRRGIINYDIDPNLDKILKELESCMKYIVV